MTRRHPSHVARKRAPLWSFLALVAVAQVAAPAWAGPRHGPPLGALVDFHADELGLDGEAREAIRGIVESSHERGASLREEIGEEMRALHERMVEDPVDREELMDRVERIGELRTEAEKHRIDTMLAIREQLTSEQRDAMIALRQDMRDRHLGPILDACEGDLAGRCEEGGPRALHCLFRNREDLSEACSDALGEMPRRFHRGSSHGRGGFGLGDGPRSRSDHPPHEAEHGE